MSKLFQSSFGRAVFCIVLAAATLAAQSHTSKPASNKNESPAFSKTDIAVFDSTLAALAQRYEGSKPVGIDLQDRTGVEDVNSLLRLDASLPDELGRKHSISHAMVLEAVNRAKKAVSLAGYKPKLPFGRISFAEAAKYHARQVELFANQMTNPPIASAPTPYDHAPVIVTLCLPVYSRNHQEALMLTKIDVGIGDVQSAYVYLKEEKKAWKAAWMEIDRYIY